tara:strand:+ start:189 stop:1124 length:936 start_codon:yes stop_codon:yes gene_type:complete
MIIYGSSDPGGLLFIKENILSNSKIQFRNIKNELLLQKGIKKKKVSAVLTGSALGNSIDKKLTNWAKKNDILSISIIEHWTNFDKRFVLNNKKSYPDYILVNDIFSKKMAIKHGMPKNKIIIFGNNYLHKLALKKIKLDKKNNLYQKRKKILFISEPITEDMIGSRNKIINNEFAYLDLVLKYAPADWETHVKLHPREKEVKYESFIKIRKFIKEKNLTKLVNNYEIIVGINSMLLVEIGLLRNNVFCLRFNSKEIFIPSQLKIIDQINNVHEFKKIFNLKHAIKKNTKFKNSFKQNMMFDDLIKKLIKNA